MTQLLEPTSDIANTSWTLSGDASVFGCIDETIAATDGDTTYVITNVLNATFTVGLSAGSRPSSLSSIVVSVRCRRSGTAVGFGTCLVELLEGVTVRSSSTVSPTAITYNTITWTVSSTDAATIVNWSNLRIRITYTSVQANTRITTLELSMSDPLVLTAATVAFALTGNAVGLNRGLRLVAGTGSLALTGQTTGLNRGRRITAGSGSFALTGSATNLRRGLILGVGSGTYSLTGNTAGLLRGRYLAVSSGSFLLSGQDAGLRAGRTLSGVTAVFSLTGTNTRLSRGWYLAATSASFLLSGQGAGLQAGRLISGSTGVFLLTGVNVGLIRGRALQAGAGLFVLTGSAVIFAGARLLRGDVGTFALSVVDTVFIRGRALQVAPGVFALVGQNANLRQARILQAGVGTYSLLGQDAELLRPLTLPGNTGVFSLTSPDVFFVRLRILVTNSWVFLLTGYPATFEATPTGNISSLLTVTDAVVADLNAGSWAFVFDAQRVFAATVELKDLNVLSVLVRCVSETPKQITRAKSVTSVIAEICVRIRLNSVDSETPNADIAKEAVDPYVELLCAIQKFFNLRRLTDIPEAKVDKATMVPAYYEADLQGFGQYTGLVRLEITDWRWVSV